MAISAGIPAPEFVLPDETGVERKLSDYRGSPVVLYFYPKDDTPGCTVEACNFRDDYGVYRA
jgi:peroxiredoxin Q/BCP